MLCCTHNVCKQCKHCSQICTISSICETCTSSHALSKYASEFMLVLTSPAISRLKNGFHFNQYHVRIPSGNARAVCSRLFKHSCRLFHPNDFSLNACYAQHAHTHYRQSLSIVAQRVCKFHEYANCMWNQLSNCTLYTEYIYPCDWQKERKRDVTRLR